MEEQFCGFYSHCLSVKLGFLISDKTINFAQHEPLEAVNEAANQ